MFLSLYRRPIPALWYEKSHKLHPEMRRRREPLPQQAPQPEPNLDHVSRARQGWPTRLMSNYHALPNAGMDISMWVQVGSGL
jgi:hypothetical protein